MNVKLSVCGLSDCLALKNDLNDHSQSDLLKKRAYYGYAYRTLHSNKLAIKSELITLIGVLKLT